MRNKFKATDPINPNKPQASKAVGSGYAFLWVSLVSNTSKVWIRYRQSQEHLSIHSHERNTPPCPLTVTWLYTELQIKATCWRNSKHWVKCHRSSLVCICKSMLNFHFFISVQIKLYIDSLFISWFMITHTVWCVFQIPVLCWHRGTRVWLDTLWVFKLNLNIMLPTQHPFNITAIIIWMLLCHCHDSNIVTPVPDVDEFPCTEFRPSQSPWQC